MKRTRQTIGVGIILLALGMQTVAGPPAAVAIPKPPKPVYEILKSLLTGMHDVPTPPVGLTVDVFRLLRKPSVTAEDRVVAKATCVAMNSFLNHTDDHDYWEDAIRDRIPPREWDMASEWLINSAVDRASNTIAATNNGPAFTKLYSDACVLKKLG